MPDVRHQHSRDDAARVFVQLAARRVPATARDSARSTTSIRRASCPTTRLSLDAGADRALGEGRPAPDRRDARGAAADVRRSIRRCRSASCRRNCATSCCSARRAGAPGRGKAQGAKARARSEAPKDPFGADFEGVDPEPAPAVRRGHLDRSGSARAVTARCSRARSCHGERLRPESRAVRVKGRRLAEYVGLPICRGPAALRDARADRARAPHRGPRAARDPAIGCGSWSMSASAT